MGGFGDTEKTKHVSMNKLFEYMASRRPIVASNLPSLREILNDRNSILVKPDDSESFAEGIKKLINNNEIGEKIADNAWTDVQNYTWAKRAVSIIGFSTRQ